MDGRSRENRRCRFQGLWYGAALGAGGGFSFFKEECITTNAQAQLVDHPRAQSDMVGTATFMGCLQSAFEILGWNERLGWRGLWAEAPEKPLEW